LIHRWTANLFLTLACFGLWLATPLCYAQVAPQAYILLDVSGSMKWSPDDDKVDPSAPNRFSLVSKWVREHARIELDAGNEVKVVAFSEKIVSEASFQPGQFEALNQWLNAQASNLGDGSKIWETLGNKIDSLGEVTPGTSIAIYTDGDDRDSGPGWDEAACRAKLQDKFRLDGKFEVNLKVFKWSTETKVLAPRGTVQLVGSTSVQAKQSDLVGTGAKVKIPVRLRVSESGTPADGITSVTAKAARAQGTSQDLFVTASLPTPITKASPDGTVELNLSGAQGGGPAKYEIQLEFTFETKLKDVKEDRVQKIYPKQLVILQTSVLNPALASFTVDPPGIAMITSDAKELTYTLRGNDDAAGNAATVSVTLPPKLIAAWVDASGANAAMSAGQIEKKIVMPAKGEALVLKARIKADGEVSGDVVATAKLQSGRQLIASTRITARGVTLQTDVSNKGRLTQLPDDADTWTRLDAGPIGIVLLTPDESTKPAFNVKLAVSSAATDVEMAFDQAGAQQLTLKSSDIPKEVPLYVRWSKGATQFEAAAVPGIEVKIEGADASKITIATPLIRIESAISPLDPLVYAVDPLGRPTDEVLLRTQSIPVGSSAACELKLSWNRAAAGSKVTLEVISASGVAASLEQASAAGGLTSANTSAREFTLGSKSLAGSLSVPVKAGDSVLGGGRLKLRAKIKSARFSGEQLLTLSAPFNVVAIKNVVTFTAVAGEAQFPFNRSVKLGALQVTGGGQAKVIKVAGALPDKSLSLTVGFGEEMKSDATLSEKLEPQTFEVFGKLSTALPTEKLSALAGKAQKGTLSVVLTDPVSISAEPTASLAANEQREVFELNLVPRVWRLQLMRGTQALDSIMPGKTSWDPKAIPFVNTADWKVPANFAVTPPGGGSEVDDLELVVEQLVDGKGQVPTIAGEAGFARKGDSKVASKMRVRDINAGNVGLGLLAPSDQNGFRFWSSQRSGVILVRTSDDSLRITIPVASVFPPTLPLFVWPLALVGLAGGGYAGRSWWLKRQRASTLPKRHPDAAYGGEDEDPLDVDGYEAPRDTSQTSSEPESAANRKVKPDSGLDID